MVVGRPKLETTDVRLVDVSTFVRLDDQLAGALRATQASAQPHGRFDQIADNW